MKSKKEQNVPIRSIGLPSCIQQVLLCLFWSLKLILWKLSARSPVVQKDVQGEREQKKKWFFCFQNCAWERKQLFCSLLGASVVEGQGAAGDVAKPCVHYLLPWGISLPYVALVGSCTVCKGKQNECGEANAAGWAPRSPVWWETAFSPGPLCCWRSDVSHLGVKCDLLRILGIAQKHLYA